MKRICIALALMVSVGCATVPPLPPGGQALRTANEVVVALGTLQHAAIELNKVTDCGGVVVISPCQKLVSDANATIVVDAVTDALTTIKATPSGWKATASVALDRISTRLDAAGKGKLSAYINALKTIAGL